MPNYYSEHGEDFILDRIFADQAHGFFVEVGCVDGRRLSNTLTFEERGWHGMCIEPHNAYIELLRQNRPNSIVCHCAVGERDEDVAVLYATDRGGLSTLNKTREDFYHRTFGPLFTGFTEQTVSKRRLDTLFREHDVTAIDILSIDVEGYELEVLKGLDLSIYRPMAMVIESDTRAQLRQLDWMLRPHGYTRVFRLEQNVLYLRNRALASRFMGQRSTVMLTSTCHPLDEGPDRQLQVVIDTRRVVLLRQQVRYVLQVLLR